MSLVSTTRVRSLALCRFAGSVRFASFLLICLFAVHLTSALARAEEDGRVAGHRLTKSAFMTGCVKLTERTEVTELTELTEQPTLTELTEL